MYIKIKDRELFKRIDESLELPDRWNEFIDIRINSNSLILKGGRESNNNYTYFCVLCNKNFIEKNIKANEYLKCPNCNNKFIVKSNRLKSYEFKDEIAILDKVDDLYVVRQFRLCTVWKNNNKNSYYFEFGRSIYDSKFNLVDEIVNDNVVGTPGGTYISFRKMYSNEWRYFRSRYTYLPNQFIWFPFNLEEMFSDNKKLKYSLLWILANRVGYFDLIYMLRNYNPSVELLIKLKLYNLALCPKTFIGKKTFEERFKGLTKDYLPFIQENNLDIDELIALSYLKTKDMKYVNLFKNVSEEKLKTYSTYNINFKTLADKTDFNDKLSYEYEDYLGFCKTLKLDLKDKDILYPKNIQEEHDKRLKEVKDKENKSIKRGIIRRYKKISKNIFENKKYIIFPAKSYEDLIDESSQQNNCVRTYAKKIANGECDIYFMRLSSDKEHSLVTIEVKENRVVQKRTKNNMETTKEQNKFIKQWEGNILNKEV